MSTAMERARQTVQQGQEMGAKEREEIAAKVAKFKPLGALSGRYHASTERPGGRRRRRRTRRKSRRKSRKKRRKSSKKRKSRRRRRR